MGAIWNMLMAGPPSFAERPLTTMLVLVPIKVQVPPRMVPKLRGMSNLPGWILADRAICTATGMKTATMGVLLMKAEMAPIASMNTAIPRASPSRNKGPRRGPMVLRAPVRSRAALSTNMNATVSVAGSLKPATASCGVITPLRVSTSAMRIATRSMLSRSVMKSTSAPVTVARTIHSWGDIGGTSVAK